MAESRPIFIACDATRQFDHSDTGDRPHVTTNPDLVVRDADGRVNTVRYEAVNAMLLNEFLKEHAKCSS